ncbi:hypothetical protein ACPXCX_53585, partial [Streptomyces sp. DT225]
VKKIAQHLGVSMTKQTFAKSVSKAVPVVGAVVSGGFTFATFLPMAKRLKKHLSGLEIAEPTGQVIVGETVPPTDGVNVPKQSRDWRLVRRRKEVEE